MRPLKANGSPSQLYCTATSAILACNMAHITARNGWGWKVGTRGSRVRSAQENQLVHPFTCQLLTEIWADARAVRPYIRSKRLAISAILRSQITENGCKNQRNGKKRTAIRTFHFYLMAPRRLVFWLSLFTKSGRCEAKVSRREGPDGLVEYSL